MKDRRTPQPKGTTTSQTSSSDPGVSPHTSSAFDLLHPHVQRWIWKQKWTELRDIQEAAAQPILDASSDIVIASATAGGKTEAAFLPIASALASEKSSAPGIRALYVSPLKALINDQYHRLEPLFAELEIGVHPWHGDVVGGRKKRLLEKPEGVLLITPESLEAFFVLRGTRLQGVFGTLRYVVVDELHAYMGAERGRQLQTLLHRLELVTRRRVPRVALSATLGDMDMACEYLRPGGGKGVRRILSTGTGQAAKLQLRGYRVTPPRVTHREALEEERVGREVELEDVTTGDAIEISHDLYETLRGGRHLAFANRRADVELYTDLLRRMCERSRVPNEFWPHHGSLDRTLREDAEAALKGAERPASIVATTTLELGIDVGQVESIAQIGPPPTVASMRQRLGRSGRRGDPAVLRIYVQESEIDATTAPQDQLRTALVQSVAMVRLLVQRWYEPPPSQALHLSTLVQQVLSMIAQYGGVRADQAWSALCKTGPFSGVNSEMFGRLLRDLGDKELIVQDHQGMLVLDLLGERVVNHHDFYAAFCTPEEYRLVSGSRTIGTLPILFPLIVGVLIIFAGRRWRVVGIDERSRTVELVPAAGGRPPTFGGSGALVHDRVREEMRDVYLEDDSPQFLNPEGMALLNEGREAFRRFELHRGSVLGVGKDTLLFPWVGDRAKNTLLLLLRSLGLSVIDEDVALLVEDRGPEDIRGHLKTLQSAGVPSALELARSVENKETAKHHRFLSEELLVQDYASSHLDTASALGAINRLLAGSS